MSEEMFMGRRGGNFSSDLHHQEDFQRMGGGEAASFDPYSN
jgi:hypothetical protein